MCTIRMKQRHNFTDLMSSDYLTIAFTKPVIRKITSIGGRNPKVYYTHAVLAHLQPFEMFSISMDKVIAIHANQNENRNNKSV